MAAVGSLVTLIMMFLLGWTILITFITVLYPTVHSIRAIESSGKSDDKVWLTYWMVFGLINVSETFFGFVFACIPYWDWLRAVVFIWLLLPQFNGSKVIYDTVIRKLLDENKDLIQGWISKVSSAAADVKKQGIQQATAAASDPSLLVKGLDMAAKGKEALAAAAAEPTKE